MRCSTSFYEFASGSAAFVSDWQRKVPFFAPVGRGGPTVCTRKTTWAGHLCKASNSIFYEVQSSLEEDKQTACLSILRSIFGTITQLDLEEMNRQLSQKEKLPEPNRLMTKDHKTLTLPFWFGLGRKDPGEIRSQAIDVTIDLFTTMCEIFGHKTKSHVEESVSLNNELVAFLLDVAFPLVLASLKGITTNMRKCSNSQSKC